MDRFVPDGMEVGPGGQAWVAPTRRLPFEYCWDQFERLCFDLVRCEGYRNVHRYASGIDQEGLDLIAERDGQRVGFQCKRRTRFAEGKVETAIRKFLAVPIEIRPPRLILIIACNLGPGAHRVVKSCTQAGVATWEGTALEARIKKHPVLLHRYFGLAPAPPPRLSDPHDVEHEQENQAATLGLPLELHVSRISFRFVPAGCLSLVQGPLSLAAPLYFGKRLLRTSEWQNLMSEPMVNSDGDQPLANMSGGMIHDFLARTQTANLDGWRMDLPTVEELRYAAAVNSLAPNIHSLGFEEFYDTVRQCCQAERGEEFGWPLVGGLANTLRGLHFEEDLTLPRAGKRRFAGLRPVLRGPRLRWKHLEGAE